MTDDELSPERSLEVRNHSPTGFEWGYGGSGPAQLALAILLDYTNIGGIALEHYMQFKDEVISRLECTAPDSCWHLSAGMIETVLRDEAELEDSYGNEKGVYYGTGGGDRTVGQLSMQRSMKGSNPLRAPAMWGPDQFDGLFADGDRMHRLFTDPEAVFDELEEEL